MWLLQDGASVHRNADNLRLLHRMFPRRLIGMGGDINYPPYSPDYNPLDYFAWGYVKDFVFSRAPRTIFELMQFVQERCDSITPLMLAHVRRSFRKRIALGIERQGRHVEHVLKANRGINFSLFNFFANKFNTLFK